MCIRCGGLHRKLGTHISRVKSVTLDAWTEEQVESMRQKGNALVNSIYNPFPDRHKFPTFSGDQEQFIRDKYERKLFAAKGQVSPTNTGMPSQPVARRQVDLLGSDFDELIPVNSQTRSQLSPPPAHNIQPIIAQPQAPLNDWADIDPVSPVAPPQPPPAITTTNTNISSFTKPVSPPPLTEHGAEDDDNSNALRSTKVNPSNLPPVFDDPWRMDGPAEGEDPFSFK